VISRRWFVKWLFDISLLSSLPFKISKASTQSTQSAVDTKGPSIGEFFANEELYYEISFMFLKKVAKVKMLFKRTEQKGRYISILQGETVGIIGWLSKYRSDTYRAVMEEVEGGKRLRSISFEENVKIGKKSRIYFHEFDYQKR